MIAAMLVAAMTTAEARPHKAASIHQLVTQYAIKHNVPPRLAHGVVHVESRYRCNAKNPHSTATGLMQVVRGTARGVGVHGNLRDCRTGLEAGMRYLKIALQRSGGDWCSAATLYNRGVYGRPGRSPYCKLVMNAAMRS